MSLRLFMIAAFATFFSSLALAQPKGVAVSAREPPPGNERRVALVIGNGAYRALDPDCLKGSGAGRQGKCKVARSGGVTPPRIPPAAECSPSPLGREGLVGHGRAAIVAVESPLPCLAGKGGQGGRGPAQRARIGDSGDFSLALRGEGGWLGLEVFWVEVQWINGFNEAGKMRCHKPQFLIFIPTEGRLP